MAIPPRKLSPKRDASHGVGLDEQVARPEPLVAPLAKGQAVATLKVSLADQPLLDQPLVVLESVAQAGFLGRAWDAIRLWVR